MLFARIQNILVALAVILVAGLAFYFLLYKEELVDLEEKPVRVSDIPAVLTEIRGIGQLTTARVYEEHLARSMKESGNYIDNSPDRLVMIIGATMRAGFDLQKLDSTHFEVRGDTLDVRLPAPEILDFSIAPKDTRVVLEAGEWGVAESNRLKKVARQKLEAKAVRKGLLKRAAENGKTWAENFFSLFGYAKVNIEIEGEDATG